MSRSGLLSPLEAHAPHPLLLLHFSSALPLWSSPPRHVFMPPAQDVWTVQLNGTFLYLNRNDDVFSRSLVNGTHFLR